MRSQVSPEEKERVIDGLIDDLSKLAPSPYRSMAPLPDKPVPSFGLISCPPRHYCSPPGFFIRLYHRIFRGVHWDVQNLWRCQCSQVWCWNYDYRYPISAKWEQDDVEVWIKNGGVK